MSGRRVKDSGDGRGRIVAVSFVCCGCRLSHTLYTQHTPADLAGPRWMFNGDYVRPTFMPSVLVTWEQPANLHNHAAMQRDLAEAKRRRDAGEQNVRVPRAAKVCHSFVADGRIQFLGDCTHALAGKTVDLPEWSGQ